MPASFNGVDRKISTALAIAVIILVAGFLTVTFYLADKDIKLATPSSSEKSALTINQETENNNLDKLAEKADSPEISGLDVSTSLKDAIIKSPLAISGKAKGIWFFEGEFQIKLMDEKGNFIATGNAIAKGDWMTEGWIPFEAALKFSKPKTSEGFLLFSRNNPSGMPKNDYSVSIPVKF